MPVKVAPKLVREAAAMPAVAVVELEVVEGRAVVAGLVAVPGVVGSASATLVEECIICKATQLAAAHRVVS